MPVRVAAKEPKLREWATAATQRARRAAAPPAARRSGPGCRRRRRPPRAARPARSPSEARRSSRPGIDPSLQVDGDDDRVALLPSRRAALSEVGRGHAQAIMAVRSVARGLPVSLRRRMDNQIHPTAVLTGEIEMGRENVIGPFCVLTGPLRMGSAQPRRPARRRSAPPATSSGSAATTPRARRSRSATDCTIREHARDPQARLRRDHACSATDVFLMHGSYVAHDTRVATARCSHRTRRSAACRASSRAPTSRWGRSCTSGR